MDKEVKRQRQLHFAVSSIGGFMGCYAVFNHGGIFANAQTSNLMQIICKIFSADFSGLIFLAAALLIYVAGIAFCAIADKYIKADLRIISLAISLATIVLIGINPDVTNDYIAILPVFFAMPVQWYAYRITGEYVCSSIFSTNNLCQAVISLIKYIMDRDKKQLDKSKFYWTTLLSFYSGAAVSCAASVFMGLASIWVCMIPIILSLILYLRLIEFNIKSAVNKDKFRKI